MQLMRNICRFIAAIPLMPTTPPTSCPRPPSRPNHSNQGMQGSHSYSSATPVNLPTVSGSTSSHRSEYVGHMPPIIARACVRRKPHPSDARAAMSAESRATDADCKLAS